MPQTQIDEAAERVNTLKALAMAATPGEWIHRKYGVIVAGPHRQLTNGAAQPQIAMLTVTGDPEDGVPDRQLANADYVAAANPAAILDLIAQLEAAKRAVLSECPPLKDHVIRETVDKLTEVARQFHGAQQLRSRIADIVVDVLRAGPAVLSEAKPVAAICQQRLRGHETWADLLPGQEAMYGASSDQFEYRMVSIAPPAAEAKDSELYRLLKVGDVIQPFDTFLQDDAVTWLVPPQDFYSSGVYSKLHRPARRAIAAKAAT